MAHLSPLKHPFYFQPLEPYTSCYLFHKPLLSLLCGLFLLYFIYQDVAPAWMDVSHLLGLKFKYHFLRGQCGVDQFRLLSYLFSFHTAFSIHRLHRTINVIIVMTCSTLASSSGLSAWFIVCPHCLYQSCGCTRNVDAR